MTNCENCKYYQFDEYYEYYICTMELDEDEMSRFISGNASDCPYYTSGDDYYLARKQ